LFRVLQLLNLVRTDVDTNILAEHEIHNFELSHHSGASDLEISRDVMQLSCIILIISTLSKPESYQFR